jgi:hypothetical protein
VDVEEAVDVLEVDVEEVVVEVVAADVEEVVEDRNDCRLSLIFQKFCRNTAWTIFFCAKLQYQVTAPPLVKFSMQYPCPSRPREMVLV